MRGRKKYTSFIYYFCYCKFYAQLNRLDCTSIWVGSSLALHRINDLLFNLTMERTTQLQSLLRSLETRTPKLQPPSPAQSSGFALIGKERTALHAKLI